MSTTKHPPGHFCSLHSWQPASIAMLLLPSPGPPQMTAARCCFKLALISCTSPVRPKSGCGMRDSCMGVSSWLRGMKYDLSFPAFFSSSMTASRTESAKRHSKP